MFSASFLIGWALKLAVVRLGGTRWFIPARIFMVGVIAGDLLGGLSFMVAGWFYYAATGLIPPAYRMMGIKLRQTANPSWRLSGRRRG